MFKRKPAAIVVGLAVLSLVVAMVLWAASKRRAPPFLAGVHPNAYDLFIRAGQLMVGFPQEAENPAEFLATNGPALAAFRRGMKEKFEAPAETYDLEQFAATVLPNMARLKTLGLAVKAEGKAAEEKMNYAQAASVYLELMEYGQKIQRGPLIFLLTGLAVEEAGFRELQQMEKKLEGTHRQQVASELERLARARISFAEVVSRERYVNRRNSPTPFHYLLVLRLTGPVIEKARSKHETVVRWEKELAERLNEGGQPGPSGIP